MGHARLPRRDTGEVPRLGVPKRAFMLVHQRDNMPWRGSGQLGEQDENMQGLRGLPCNVRAVARMLSRKHIDWQARVFHARARRGRRDHPPAFQLPDHLPMGERGRFSDGRQ